MGEEVKGQNQRDVLTGQVPVEIGCPSHRVVPHDAEGSAQGSWCNRCGKNDAGDLLGRPSGGWM